MKQDRMALMGLGEEPPFLEQIGWQDIGDVCEFFVEGRGPGDATPIQYVSAKTIRDSEGALITKWLNVVRLEILEREIAVLRERTHLLEEQRPLLVPVQTLEPEPYRTLAPFTVVVRAEQDEYLASWFDANLVASGSSPEEAFSNLKDIIVAVYESLKNLPEEQMGPGPARQIKILRKFITEE
jgi:hypothetical protein